MSDQERYDRLDAALDAALRTGAPATTGDRELDGLARLATGLRELPDPEFRARLAAELFPPRRRGWWPFPRSDTMTATSETIRHPALRFGVPALAAALGAAAVIAAVFLIRPAFDDGGGELAYGTLPAPSYATGGGGGDGSFSIDPPGPITYSAGSGLVLPESAPVFDVRPEDFTLEDAQRIAAALGFTAPVQELAQDPPLSAFYSVEEPVDCTGEMVPSCTRSFAVFPDDGMISFYDYGVPREGPVRPTAEEAFAAARDWMELIGLETEGAVFRSTFPDQSGCEPGCWSLVAEPVASPLLISPTTPGLSFVVNFEGRVGAVSGHWVTVESEAAYPLHTTGRMLQDLELVRGDFDSAGVPLGGPGRALPAQATILSAELRWTEVAGESGETFLVPVYLLTAELTQEGLAAPVPFETWVSAVDTAPAQRSGRERPPEVEALVAVYRALPLHPAAVRQDEGRVWETWLHEQYFVDAEVADVRAFYRGELLGRGWQAEAEPSLRFDTQFYNGGDPSEYETFLKDGYRAGVRAVVNEKDPPRGATQLFIVIEPID